MNILKYIVGLFVIGSLMACSLTPSQQELVVRVSNVAISKINKNNMITADERAVLEAAIKASVDPASRTKDELIAQAEALTDALLAASRIKQEEADLIKLALAVGKTFL